MALSAATLASGLEALVPVGTEAEAIQNLATAFSAYAAQAAAASPLLAAGVTAGRAAFVTAAAGVATPGQGAARIVAAIQAYWAAVAAGLAASFAGATAITPPFGSLVAADLTSVFDSATASSMSRADAAQALANAIHARRTGGAVTTPGPTVTPIA